MNHCIPVPRLKPWRPTPTSGARSSAARHVEAVAAANPPEDEEAERRSRKTGKYKKISTTDPDATMATSGRNRRLEPSFKQHTAVDDLGGVVLDVTITTARSTKAKYLRPRWTRSRR